MGNKGAESNLEERIQKGSEKIADYFELGSLYAEKGEYEKLLGKKGVFTSISGYAINEGEIREEKCASS